MSEMQKKKRPAIEVRNLSFSYGKNEVLHDISLKAFAQKAAIVHQYNTVSDAITVSSSRYGFSSSDDNKKQKKEVVRK